MRHKTDRIAAFLAFSAIALLAATHAGVDLNSAQTLSNKTIALLKYYGKLTIESSAICSESASFTIGHDSCRVHLVTTGSSADVVATAPGAPSIMDVYDVCKYDTGSKAVVLTKSGSQVFKYAGAGSANTLTLIAGGDCETIGYWSSNQWIGRGNGL